MAQRYDNYLPDSTSVVLDQSTLPIIVISTNNTVIQRRNTINATMKVVNNGDGATNYGDLSTHASQTYDYNGSIALRYAGNASFVSSAKKPYEITLSSSAALLGMNSATRWTLLAPMNDRSLIRSSLALELVRSYMPCVPQAKFCEVIVDDVYRGIFLLIEDLSTIVGSSDHLFAVDYANANNLYTSTNKALKTDGSSVSYANVTYKYIYPTYSAYSDASVADAEIAAFETSFTNSTFAEQIDTTVFCDYLLATELAHDINAYRLSAFLLKPADGLFQMVPYLADLGFGNSDAFEGFRTDTWSYNNNDLLTAQDDPQLVPFYWYNLIHNASFQSLLKQRWAGWRASTHTVDNVYAKVDSIVNVLKNAGALTRDGQAWQRWGQKLWLNYNVPASYDDEITYLKNWIKERLGWMDENIGQESVIDPTISEDDYEIVTTPITISSGFNTDCIAENSSVAPTSATDHPAVDGHGSVFIGNATYPNGSTLPDDGALTTSEGHKFQLADYASENCLYLAETGSSATLTFSEEFTCDTLCVLAVGTNKGNNYTLSYTAVINYSDGTTSTVTKNISDWCLNDQSDFVLTSYNRWRADYGSGGVDGTTVHFSETLFPVNNTKAVKSVTFTSNCKNDSWGYGHVGIFAISAMNKVTTTGIVAPQTETQKIIQAIYSVDGRQQTRLNRGINIVKYTDGTTKKIVVK